MNATEKIIEIITSYSKELESSGLLSRALVSNQQLIGAIKSFAKGVNPDAIIAMFDNTPSCNGEEGIVFTTSAIYFSVVDVSGMSIKCAMLRYVDIVSASISSDKLSDFLNVVQINIKNLPYDYYKVTSWVIKKTPFVSLINEIHQLADAGYVYESDHIGSMINIRNYLCERDDYMKTVYTKICNGENLSGVRGWVTDSIGLTAMHYCIAMNDIKNARRIISKTMKNNAQVYLINQPFGIYNYCMTLAMAGLEEEKISLFGELFMYTDEMKKLEKKRKYASAKETIKEVAQFMWDSLVKTVQNNAERAIACADSEIEQQEKYVQNLEEKADDLMSRERLRKEQERLDQMKNRADEIRFKNDRIAGMENQSKYSTDYDETFEETGEAVEGRYENFNDESEYKIAEDDYSSLVTVEEIEERMKRLVLDHIDECERALEQLKNAYNHGDQDIDPRFPIINELMSKQGTIGDRLNADANALCLLHIKFKYFFVQKTFLERFPSLKAYEVQGE